MSLSTARPADHLVFIGTSTKTSSRGIYALRFNDSTGALSAPEVATELANPGFLALHPNGHVLYAIGDVGMIDGKPAGSVSAYTIEPATGHLTLLNQQPSGGASLTHLAVDATGRMLVAVSYGAGYVVSFPLAADGRVGPRVSHIDHHGALGPNASRQDKPHAHSVTISPDNRFAFVADLGLDRVFSYQLDPAKATIVPYNAFSNVRPAVEPAGITIAPGAGPRHSKFSADGKSFYVLDEIDGSITSCSYDSGLGVATPFQHISTLPQGFKVEDPDRAAEIRIHPNGKFVYASNRGHDSIAVFARDTASGRLTLVEIAPCGGKEPRNFALSPDGAWLICAHQNSDTLAAFRVDPATGRLTQVGGTVSVPMPICVLFAD